MTIPTRAEMCADLARAMFPTAVIEPSLSGSGVDIRIYDKPNETRSWRNFDPFTNAADKDALVKGLAEQSPVAWGNFTGCLIDAAIPFHVQPYADWEMVCRAVLTAPIETIAEAAWRAIQEAKCE